MVTELLSLYGLSPSHINTAGVGPLAWPDVPLRDHEHAHARATSTPWGPGPPGPTPAACVSGNSWQETFERC